MTLAPGARFNVIHAGGSTMATSMPTDVLAITAANGAREIYPGQHALVFSTGGAVPDLTTTISV